jgi:hypothetical protein
MSWVGAGIVGTQLVGGAIAADKNRPSSSNRAYENKVNMTSSMLLDKGVALSNRPYKGYEKERVAKMSENENIASSKARSGYEDSRGMIDKARQTIDGVAGEEWNADTQKKYMDPYADEVIGGTLRKENEAYQQEQNRLRTGAASRGAFGGSRATLLEAETTGRHLDTVGDLTARGKSSAYNNAFSMWQADSDRKLGAARAYENVGGDLARLNTAQIQDLIQTGGADRVLRQLTNDTDYAAFIEERDWEVTNLQPLIQSIAASKGGNVQRDTSKHDAATSALGGVASLIGYFGSKSGGGSGSSGGGSIFTGGNLNETMTGSGPR